jgi:diguanylate cyclase (GGDEF)-like protein/PAS domain S-box-containing protein
MTPINNRKTLHHKFILNDPLHQLFDEVQAISVQGYDEDRKVIYWNSGSELLYGYSKKEAIGKKLEELIIPSFMRDSVISGHSDWILKDKEIPASEITLLDKSGHDVHVFSSHVMFTNQHHKKQMYCIDVNLADARHAQAQVVFKEHMLKTVFEATPDVFFLMQENGTIIDYYAGNENTLIQPSECFLGKMITDTFPPEAAAIYRSNLTKVIHQKGTLTFEYQLPTPNGFSHFEARMSHLADYHQIVTIVRNITEKYKSSEIIRQHAYFDALTSLPNRLLSLEHLTQMLNNAVASPQKTTVFFLDLDDFKKVNDSLGHEVGDKLLIESARRLTQVIGKDGTIGRLGGDEFIILSQHLPDHTGILNFVNDILNAFKHPFYIDERELILTISIGIAESPENGNCVSDLLRNADTAMYQAKALGRNAYSFFTKEMNTTMLRRFEIEEQMHGALERNEFEVFYQPQLNAKNKQIIGAEALLRWNNPNLGNVTPDEFIPIAEQTDLIIPIGRYVIKQAIEFLNEWQRDSDNKYTMAVNLSPAQFKDNDLITFIQQCLDEAKIPAKSFELEITEGVLMTGKSDVAGALLTLHKLGVQLSMDDFGTGYSSLSYLREYSFDVLKIDKTFINGITLNKADRDLVKASIAMAHSLGLEVVAEGVEMDEQLAILNELNCDFVQGFYFSKPIPAKEFLLFSKHYKNKL